VWLTRAVELKNLNFSHNVEFGNPFPFTQTQFQSKNQSQSAIISGTSKRKTLQYLYDNMSKLKISKFYFQTL